MNNTGRLYHSGELADQPNWLIEAQDIYEREQTKKQKADKAKAGKGE